MPLVEWEGRLIDRDAQLRELDRADAEESLSFFLKKAWKYIDPAPFTDGWVIDALAEHLEAVADGDIRRLLINIPPRHSKPVAATEMVSTQEFGLVPLSDVVPGVHVLTHRNRFRRVLAVHQQGALPTLRLTTRKGRTVVAAGDHPFYTTDNWRELRYITQDDRVGVVPQFDYLTSGRPTMAPETARLLGYLVGDGSCRGTPNITVADDPEAADIHHVVRAAGFVPTEQTYRMAQTGYMLRRIGIRAAAGQMKRPTKASSGPVKQFMQRYGLWEKSSYTKRVPQDVMRGDERVISEFLGAYWACDGFITKKTADRTDHLIGCDSVSLDMLRDIQMLLLRLGIDSRIRRKVAKVKTKKQGDTYTSYSLTLSDQYNCWQFARRVYLKHTKDERLTPLRRANAPDFARDVVPDVVESVEPSGAVECMCLTVEEDESFVVNGFAVHNSSICSVAFPAWIWAQEYESPTSGPGVPIVSGSYAFKLSVRDSVKCRRLIASPWYQSLWGHRFSLLSDSNQKIRFGNTRGGERIVTAVDGGITGEGGNIIIIDDPNNAKEVLSEAVIEATNEDWWDGTMSTRLNDPKTGAYIVIQQRLGEADLTGHILSKPSGKDWTHLMLPAEYEPQRAFVTSIGWEDPRTEPGELLWPERMGHAEIASLKADLGSWRCNPGEAPILMADTTMRPIRDIRIGDEIMGFDKKQRTDDKNGRMKLTKAVVTDIHSFVSPVVKMTLDSGEVIRCTRDHRWYLKDRGPTRDMYGSVVLGRTKLARVCPARLPTLTAEEQRRAGWLGGFFDGEGTISQQQRPGSDYTVGNTIVFYQGAGRNKPLCDKLEENLRYFGFEFTYAEDERKPNKDAPCYGYRTYRIKSDGLPTFQRFLHIVQPTKWRDRLQSGVFKTNFVKGREKVVKIEPDGEEVVYGLTTTTGNYVVWGLASSNSAGQLQQRPEPAGGGIIKREHWQLWPPEGEPTDNLGRIIKPAAYPPMDYILASVDTAFTEKTMNDESALTIWGVFSGETVSRDLKTSATSSMRVTGETSAKVMLMYCWHGRLELHELVNTIAKHCKQYRVDKILIENKASGISVAQEMRRLFSTEGFAIQLNDPGNVDKLARLYSVQNIFEEGQVYAPERQWSEDVMAQCGTFPNAKHDDIVDTVSQALRHLRDLGLIVRPAERMQELNDSLSFIGSAPPPLYPA